MVRRARVVLLIACLFFSSPARASDGPIAIAEILSAPDAYHLQVVALQGRVGDVRQLEPYFLSSGTACYGAYTFSLEDDAGSVIEVAVLGLCGPPVIRFPEVSDGDLVLIQAQIRTFERSGSPRSFEIPGRVGSEPAVQAIARSISRIGE
jgi:hypothetical protein